MPWIFPALLSPMLYAVAVITDKYLLTRGFPSVSAFNVVFSLLQMVVIVIYVVGASLTVGLDTDLTGILWALLSGMLAAGGIVFFFHGLQLEEASRATPIQMTAPIFASLGGVILLGESINVVQWMAIVTVVIGATLVSTRLQYGLFRIARGRALRFLLCGAIVMGMAYVANKEATNYVSVWTIMPLRSVAMGIGVMLISGRPKSIAEAWVAIRDPRVFGLTVMAEVIVAPVAGLLFTIALSQGPVSLISAVQGVRPLIVLILTTLFSTKGLNIFDEPLDKRTIGTKVIAVVLIVGGIAVMNLAAQAY
jgi:drug/metabolite transporter (DMT)-like permease